MSAYLPADMVNQKLADLGIPPNRFSITSSRCYGAYKPASGVPTGAALARAPLHRKRVGAVHYADRNSRS